MTHGAEQEQEPAIATHGERARLQLRGQHERLPGIAERAGQPDPCCERLVGPRGARRALDGAREVGLGGFAVAEGGQHLSGVRQELRSGQLIEPSSWVSLRLIQRCHDRDPVAALAGQARRGPGRVGDRPLVAKSVADRGGLSQRHR